MTSIKNITEFVLQENTPREVLLAPWLQSGELVMIYAPTGVGKSMLAVSLCYSVATGRPFLCWHSKGAKRVCYIEAEMGIASTKARLLAVENASDVSAPPENFLVVSRDQATNHLPNIGTKDGQAAILPIVEPYDLIVIDNLTSAALPENGRDDDVRIWYRMKPFLFDLRNRNKTVVIIHHSGKSGLQLGTSLRENDMDTIIKLSRPVKSVTPYRLAMQIQFEKTRNLLPGEATNLYAEYYTTEGKAAWDYLDLKELVRSQIRETANTIKNKATLSMMFHVSLLEVYEALEPVGRPCTFSEFSEQDCDKF